MERYYASTESFHTRELPMERYRNTFDNKTKFIKKIGEGSQATVDLHKLHTGPEVAVKNYHSINGTIPAEALREVNSLQRLKDCKNIIQLFSITTEVLSDEIILRLMLNYMKYDLSYYIENTPLVNRLNNLNSVMNQLLGALNNLYYRGILHCDIKPENILVTIVNKDVQVYLADFGLSIQLPCEVGYRNIYKNIQGTPLFKAPELLVENHYYTEKIDIWSLGLTLLEYIVDDSVTMPKIQRPDHIIYAILEKLTNPLPRESVQQVKDGQIHDSIDVDKLITEKITKDIHDKMKKEKVDDVMITEKVTQYKKIISPDTIKKITSMLQINPVDRYDITTVTAKVCPIIVEELARGPIKEGNTLDEFYVLVYKMIYVSQRRLNLQIDTIYRAIDFFSRYCTKYKIQAITSAACLVLMSKLFEENDVKYNTITSLYDGFTTTELKYEELLVMKNANYIFTFCDNDEIIDTLKRNAIGHDTLFNTYKVMKEEQVYPGEMFTFEIIEYMKK
jgi:serine/threonine protein kinase